MKTLAVSPPTAFVSTSPTFHRITFQRPSARRGVAESPILIYPGQSVAFQVVIDGQGTIGASPTMLMYKGLNDDSANVLSGALGVSERAITSKTITGLSGGSDYIFYVYFTDGGKSTVRYGEVICPKLGAF